MTEPLLKQIIKPGAFLAGFALLGTLALASVYDLTLPTVEANERAATLKQLNVLVDSQTYDNDLLASKQTLPAADFGSAEDVTVYRASKQGLPIAALFIVSAPDGYSGKIRLAVGIRADQTLAGVRVLAHKETPGLGDKIDADKHPWILSFADKSLQHPTAAGWAVRKDGGEFDQFTGATITPRAVVNATKRTLDWSAQHFATLFTAIPTSAGVQP
ncbi:electron transport complex subunit RsxG [Thiothrix subterranea]|uniref:Ion-translocating oxidoreductase complex subunit G n=1 Tax=Thiothrix subterranea TaxID=2735563 RepID=A0AA51R315_9GAMM|nr:electron transport complex subunit RsxG [Thiothrix subterranea]MDQ5770392.1 electron transport complex subunit RsxG [Thiothrix subterranea]WML85100.1 electron transport complex subunit RsxG [Thiothrix subterranea]